MNEVDKIEIHILFCKLYKKIIESAIEKEKNPKNSIIFGYNVSFSHMEDIYFNCLNHLFLDLMTKKEIIFKTKLKEEEIYFPMLILCEIINKDIIHFDNSSIVHTYFFEYALLNEDIDEIKRYYDGNGMFTDKKYFMNKMLNKNGEYWIQHAGNSRKQTSLNIIFNFEDSKIDQYIYENNNYFRIKKTRTQTIDMDGNLHIEEPGSIILFIEENKKKIKEDERSYLYAKKNSKFDHSKKRLTEYTLQDILEYLNHQIDIYENEENKKLTNEEILIESKNPKNIQRLLDLGISIEEALESVGF